MQGFYTTRSSLRWRLIALGLVIGFLALYSSWQTEAADNEPLALLTNLREAPEHRCSPYERKRDYSYPQSVEERIIASMDGRIYGPYTGRYFDNRRETDIEHMVSASEAHDSGLCARDRNERRAFARDTDNLTLAAPRLNRQQKVAKDAADWLPEKNTCWFAARIVRVKHKYGLSVDSREKRALHNVLSNCELEEMRLIYYEQNTSI